MPKPGKIAEREASPLVLIYDLLDGHFGDLRWWPAKSPFEVIIGAILTQNTAWVNVEKAIGNLRERHLLSPEALAQLPEEELAELIRPSGYYRLKTRRLKSFLKLLFDRYGGDLGAMFAREAWDLRGELLQVNGIGEETADSILLYAGIKPVFVIDAYTRRIFSRHGIIREGASYGDIQSLVMNVMAPDVRSYNQFHALLVNTAKHFCRKRPACSICPLSVLPGNLVADP
ncbi:MAG: endonuclease III domain-containing protein [Smithellaceae bacterium]|nr:endonuclease III domain-containing protein [Smithellaceae bacterium]